MVRISPRSHVSSRERVCSFFSSKWVARLALSATLAAIGFCQFNRSQQGFNPLRDFSSKQRQTSLRAPAYSILTSSGNEENDSNIAVQEQCRFYLAESAIPMSGLGLFTATDIATGEQAQSMPDICIYVADTPEGTHFETHS